MPNIDQLGGGPQLDEVVCALFEEKPPPHAPHEKPNYSPKRMWRCMAENAAGERVPCPGAEWRAAPVSSDMSAAHDLMNILRLSPDPNLWPAFVAELKDDWPDFGAFLFHLGPHIIARAAGLAGEAMRANENALAQEQQRRDRTAQKA